MSRDLITIDPAALLRTEEYHFPGTYVEDIDQKKHLFCNKCNEELKGALSS
jgi:hypothetical protein